MYLVQRRPSNPGNASYSLHNRLQLAHQSQLEGTVICEKWGVGASCIDCQGSGDGARHLNKITHTNKGTRKQALVRFVCDLVCPTRSPGLWTLMWTRNRVGQRRGRHYSFFSNLSFIRPGVHPHASWASFQRFAAPPCSGRFSGATTEADTIAVFQQGRPRK
ncbi:hypothetical protein FA13DRAFT_549124 [Coprinellus micaceus]|uniref:Uncharacterized protein n=1 Tax=Coprinellus micaceus TaxID=71717 RepID=A0A4Y7T9Z8_COPMI|nr:hypothetical protein FA13DRAFT_549124 [Coprinellus micaceus]